MNKTALFDHVQDGTRDAGRAIKDWYEGISPIDAGLK
jgi:hypothetical protein